MPNQYFCILLGVSLLVSLGACSDDHSVHGNNNNNVNQEGCGNNVVEAPEECDVVA